MLLWPMTETANCLPVSISSLIIRSRIPLLPGFSKAYHCSDIDYILLPILQSSVWLISGQWYLTGNVTMIFGITSFNRKLFALLLTGQLLYFKADPSSIKTSPFLLSEIFSFCSSTKFFKATWKKKVLLHEYQLSPRGLSYILYLWIPVKLTASSSQWGQWNS